MPSAPSVFPAAEGNGCLETLRRTRPCSGPEIVIDSISPVRSPGMVRYAASRGISRDTECRCCREARWHFAWSEDWSNISLALATSPDGWVLRSPRWRLRTACAPTLIGDGGSEFCVVFEGLFDWLSFEDMFHEYTGGYDICILNGISANLEGAMKWICAHSTIILYLDNDDEGRSGVLKVNEKVKGTDKTVRDMTGSYGDCNDLNEHYVKYQDIPFYSPLIHHHNGK